MAGRERNELDTTHDEQCLVSHYERVGPLLFFRERGKGSIDFATVAGVEYFERDRDS